MFLFNSRTKKVIRWLWAVFAILIILSMIIAYSGFVTLATLPTSQSVDVPQEVLDQLAQQKNASNTPEIEALLKQLSASGTVNIATPTIERTPASSTPPEPPKQTVPQLKFEI
ncbi:MAG: hypothetical protein KBD21_01355 [Candidatus Pacebacteria bacterium]|nr:hypothetical protein [Candidatus Paceibacterota bacterium]